MAMLYLMRMEIKSSLRAGADGCATMPERKTAKFKRVCGAPHWNMQHLEVPCGRYKGHRGPHTETRQTWWKKAMASGAGRVKMHIYEINKPHRREA